VVIFAALLASLSGGAIYAKSPQPTLTLSVSAGRPGDFVTVTGTGWPPGELVALYMDRPDAFLDAPGPRADAQGGFTDKVSISAAGAGGHSICGDTAYPGSAQPVVARVCAPFTILASQTKPSLTASPTRAPGPAGAPFPLPLLAVGIVIAMGGGLFWLIRRSG
jgi:hypothetical protein